MTALRKLALHLLIAAGVFTGAFTAAATTAFVAAQADGTTSISASSQDNIDWP